MVNLALAKRVSSYKIKVGESFRRLQRLFSSVAVSTMKVRPISARFPDLQGYRNGKQQVYIHTQDTFPFYMLQSNTSSQHLEPHSQQRSPLHLTQVTVAPQNPFITNSLLVNSRPQKPAGSPVLHQRPRLGPAHARALQLGSALRPTRLDVIASRWRAADESHLLSPV